MRRRDEKTDWPDDLAADADRDCRDPWGTCQRCRDTVLRVQLRLARHHEVLCPACVRERILERIREDARRILRERRERIRRECRRDAERLLSDIALHFTLDDIERENA